MHCASTLAVLPNGIVHGCADQAVLEASSLGRCFPCLSPGTRYFTGSKGDFLEHPIYRTLGRSCLPGLGVGLAWDHFPLVRQLAGPLYMRSIFFNLMVFAIFPYRLNVNMHNNLTLASPATHKNMPLLLAHMRGLAAAYCLIRTSVSKYGLTEPGKRNAADKLLADTGCSSLALSQGREGPCHCE